MLKSSYQIFVVQFSSALKAPHPAQCSCVASSKQSVCKLLYHFCLEAENFATVHKVVNVINTKLHSNVLSKACASPRQRKN